MDEKMFELMTKMYSDMQEMKTDLKVTKSDVNKIKSDIGKICNKIENDIEPKLEALFDGYKQTFEIEKENSKKLDDISDKVSKQEVEIKKVL
jgi:hypothetical protein